MSANSHPEETGFTLIEVLVAVLLLSVGFLTLAALHGASLQYSRMAATRSMAVQIAAGLADRMRARSAVLGAPIVPPVEALRGDIAVSSSAAPVETSASDLAWARQAATAQLPGGEVTVFPNPLSGHADIWVLWDEPQAGQAIPAGCPVTFNDDAGHPRQCLGIQVPL